MDTSNVVTLDTTARFLPMRGAKYIQFANVLFEWRTRRIDGHWRRASMVSRWQARGEEPVRQALAAAYPRASAFKFHEPDGGDPPHNLNQSAGVGISRCLPRWRSRAAGRVDTPGDVDAARRRLINL